MTSSFPHELKKFVLKEFQKHLDKEPPIDGEKGSPEQMFMWSNNVSSPLCCPSTISTSTGCLCTTKKQRDLSI